MSHFIKTGGLLLLLLSLFLSGCGVAQNPTSSQGEGNTSTDGEVISTQTPASEVITSTPAPIESTEETTMNEMVVAKNGKPFLDDSPPRPYENYWQTDFSLHTVPYSEIFSGGVARDGIPPIDDPQFVSVAEATTWLNDREPIFVVTHNEETKGYPLQVLTWHEIVNDELGGEPIVVTFCPLCNSAITFKRTLNDTVYDFGVSGKLRNSDLIMWDRQTESWWQQLTGESIVGTLVGEQLTFIPTQLTAFKDFKANFPDARVLSQDTGTRRDYGSNPYAGYDTSPQPFLFAGELDRRLEPMERVIAITLRGESVAYPYSVLAEAHVVADTVAEQDVVIFWQGGTTSALDQASIANSRDVGAATAYSPNLNDQMLTFSWADGQFVDDQTGSTWTIFGEAITGDLAGEQLTPIIHANHFWFAWAAFRPDTRVFVIED